MATISMGVARKWNRTITRHLNLFYLLVFALFAYHNLAPFGLVGSQPARDAAEGKLLWAKGFLLGSVAILIPLLSPRPYIPVDEKVLRLVLHRIAEPR